MPATGALPYQPVARVRSTGTPLPISSPTLLTRRRYSRSSVVGFEKGGTLAPGPTGVISPHPWPGEGAQWPGFPYHPRSNVAIFYGSQTGQEQNPDKVKMPIGYGRNLLVAIAHRSTYPQPQKAINAGLWARRATTVSAAPAMGRGRRYALPYQFGMAQSDIQWPTSSQWLASRMTGTA